ncbi:alpha/beta hydrolase [Bifidobacterium xylocopae]|uniref:Alpha/beta hydrolase n=1 Tax=Bifidobacterium xylocopae TaxID=2493119 RepID=A0A366KED6_9BIFI|nr:alpha/beta hydrolase [Bifidobacterium xylocopae]RBP99939.1 hypothetical protein CRD59_00240 [Bifidobacterium xylocopae]
MTKRIESSISGHGLSQADLAMFTATAKALDTSGADLDMVANSWSGLRGQLMIDSARIAGAPCRTLSADPPPGHAEFDFPLFVTRCDEHSQAFNAMAQQLTSVADGLIKAYSLYSGAEDRISRLMGALMDLAYDASPLLAGGMDLAGGAVGSVHENVSRGRGFHVDWADVSHRTRNSQERFMNALARQYNGALLGQGRGGVNTAAGKISLLTSWMTRHIQGDRLTVTKTSPAGLHLDQARTIGDALTNLQKLGDKGQDGDYATVAVQRYRHPDGSQGWVVTIPGTDGRRDSPMGWEQNLELMSSSSHQREQAASARLVREAMARAGVGAGDQVALVGHSQGGIAAAAIASDLSDRYAINHVITAGSPVANHPIPPKTWVTSVEMDDELVSSLDGAHNPGRDSWLTVRGSMGGNGSPVAHASTGPELTHGMNYQRAAWRNAASQGTPALNRHDRHFGQVTRGELMGTEYYRGRMGH